MAKKILIIEDEPIHLNVMKAKLEFEGYEVIVAMDGETGLNMARTAKPDLILLDIILPKMDGFQILENLQKEKISTPVIVVSNSGQPVEVDKALKMGVKDYLVKAEFNPSDVVEKVSKILGLAKKGEPSQPQGTPAAAGTQSPEIIKPAGQEGIEIKGQKVLIVEDDKFLRDLINQKLQREGFTTFPAIDGEEGLKIAKEKKPDIVLLDLILPSIDGFEVLRLLKSAPDTSSIPVIVLSNLGQKEDMERAMAGGAEDFMVKAHFTPGEIVAKIKSVLQKKKS